MLYIATARIHTYEKGLLFRGDEFVRVLGPGRHWAFNPAGPVRIDVSSQRDPWIKHRDLDVIVKSGLLANDALVLDLKDHERALVWIDGRLNALLRPGLYALWTGFREVRTEILDARATRFDHPQLDNIVKLPGTAELLNVMNIEEGHVGVYFRDGDYVETLSPGRYAFWRDTGKIVVHRIDLREKVLDVGGQDIMTADKVTLRLNAVLTYRVADALKSVTRVEDVKQTLYRDVQLALRAAVGTRELDTILSEKDSLVTELEAAARQRSADFGVEIIALGIRDIILPGDMRTLLNKVTEAKKAAEANLIARREETAAMRSQANTAKLLDENPTLMRLRELEILTKIAETSKLQVVLGEKGLADRIVNLL